jgi:hypothetical protein
MKKSIIVLLLLVTWSSIVFAQFIRIWEKSTALNNLPSWFSETETREKGIAFSIFNGVPKLYVISNRAEPTVIILNALTGDSIGVLNTTGVSGGLLPLSDISSYGGDFIIWGPELYACNLTEDATVSPFKIYFWESDSSAPELFIVDSLATYRLGDHLNLGIIFHYVCASSNNNKVVDYYTLTGNPPYIRREITLNDGNMGNNASVDFNYIYPLFDEENYIVNSDGFLPKFYDSSGVFHFNANPAVVSTQSNSIKFYANGTICCDLPFYTSYQYDNNNAALILGFPTWEIFWGETPSLGNNPNPLNYGDVEYAWLTGDSLYIFVIAGNNGIGAYYAPGLALPVELISFDAKIIDEGIKLNWVTASELNNQGFEVERKIRKTSRNEFPVWEKIGFVSGAGTTVERRYYSFSDTKVESGVINYRLKQIDFDGSFEYSNVIEIEILPITKFQLYQSYPNPFNPSTTIKFVLPVKTDVVLDIYNYLGEKVAEAFRGEMEEGYHEVKFDASNLSSGVYFYRFESKQFVDVKKMVLTK